MSTRLSSSSSENGGTITHLAQDGTRMSADRREDGRGGRMARWREWADASSAQRSVLVTTALPNGPATSIRLSSAADCNRAAPAAGTARQYACGSARTGQGPASRARRSCSSAVPASPILLVRRASAAAPEPYSARKARKEVSTPPLPLLVFPSPLLLPSHVDQKTTLSTVHCMQGLLMLACRCLLSQASGKLLGQG